MSPSNATIQSFSAGRVAQDHITASSWKCILKSPQNGMKVKIDVNVLL